MQLLLLAHTDLLCQVFVHHLLAKGFWEVVVGH